MDKNFFFNNYDIYFPNTLPYFREIFQFFIQLFNFCWSSLRRNLIRLTVAVASPCLLSHGPDVPKMTHCHSLCRHHTDIYLCLPFSFFFFSVSPSKNSLFLSLIISFPLCWTLEKLVILMKSFKIKTKYHFWICCQCSGLSTFPLSFSPLEYFFQFLYNISLQVSNLKKNLTFNKRHKLIGTTNSSFSI